MGVNRVGFGIVDDEVVQEASRQEIIRRYFQTECDFKKGLIDEEAVNRIKLIMEEVGLQPEDRQVVLPAHEYAKTVQNDSNDPSAVIAIQLPDEVIITGRTSSLMNASAAVILNAIKHLAHISDNIPLLSPLVLERIQGMKSSALHSSVDTLSLNEVLIALSISAVTNPIAQVAYDKLAELDGAQAHSTVIVNKNDEQTLKQLGIDITSAPFYPSENLFYQ